MKNFKKLIKEAHLGNPLNEEDRATRVDKMLAGEYKDEDYKDSEFYADVRADLEAEMNEGYDDKDIVIYDGEEHIIMRKDGNMVYIRPLEDSAILGKKDEIKVPARALAYKSDLDKMYDEYKPKDEVNEENEKWDKISKMEYGKPWMELSIAQKQELLSYMNRETEKQFQTDYERRRRGDYSDDREDGMTDYQRRRMDEDMGEWPKELSSRYSDEYRFELEKVMSDRAKYRVIDIESGELKGTPAFGKPEHLMAFADDLIKPQGGTQSTNLGESLEEDMKKQDLKEFGSSDRNALLSSMHINLGYPKEFPGLSKIMDAAGDATDFYMDDFEEYSTNRDELVMSNARAYARREFPDFMAQAAKFIEPVDEAIDANDPVLMKARAAKIADEKEKAKQAALNKKYGSSFMDKLDAEINLKQELQDLKDERDQLMIDMEQEAEPEGGEIADEYGSRLNNIDAKMAVIKSELEDLRMYESVNKNINENTLGDLVKKYGKDLINFVIDIDELTKEEIKDVEYLDDRIQIHLEEPEIRQRYLPEGTCGYGEDGVIGDKPAGPDLNEDEIPSYLTKNIIFGKAVEDSVSFNDFQKRVYGILGPKYYKLIDQGALKDFYDSVRVTKPSMEEAFDLDIDDAHSGDTALDRTVGKMGYNESLKKSLKESLNKRLGK